MGKKRMDFTIDSALAGELRTRAEAEDRPMSYIVSRALREHFAEDGRQAEAAQPVLSDPEEPAEEQADSGQVSGNPQDDEIVTEDAPEGGPHADVEPSEDGSGADEDAARILTFLRTSGASTLDLETLRQASLQTGISTDSFGAVLHRLVELRYVTFSDGELVLVRA